MIVVGVDENGLGPLLGPLVATAVTIEVERYDATRLRKIGERAGIHDSKQTGAFGQMQWTESLVLALLRAQYGALPQSYDEVLGWISLDAPDVLQAECPSASHAQCWSRPIALPAFDGDVSEGEAALKRLDKAGVRIGRVRTTLACAGSLNASFARGATRVGIDLSLFERLLIDARAQWDDDVQAICGMVGGIRDYPEHFTRFDKRSVVEGKHRKLSRSYVVSGIGDVSFVIDADASHLPVGLASMVGKYVRELAMERQNRFYRHHDDQLATGSGYHDPVTLRFVRQSVELRRRLGVVDACFAR